MEQKKSPRQVLPGDVWANPRGKQYRVVRDANAEEQGVMLLSYRRVLIEPVDPTGWPKHDFAIADLMMPSNGWTLVSRRDV